MEYEDTYIHVYVSILYLEVEGEGLVNGGSILVHAGCYSVNNG